MDLHKEVEKIIENLEDKNNELEVLEFIQNSQGYISKDMIKFVADKMDKFDFSVENTIKFYPHLKGEGKQIIEVKVCTHTACKNNGSGKVLEEAKKILGVETDEITSDGKYKLMTQRCFGQCGKGPNVKIGDETYNKVTPEILDNLLKK
ncbi:NAD(P)H-dependent oxidoreductase subunit E [Psychrilyobacter atlanticus]|uniref:NADH-quinone oxidoreductase subunit NuoE family protein n=1 Tax=Psychrilyobacter atlanticus TaxID=271091 RepID=UPI00040ECBA2|nr:NAD(P)H-dependent oxidoreductase subunit E [Psychrilyobacter atlanticus]